MFAFIREAWMWWRLERAVNHVHDALVELHVMVHEDVERLRKMADE